MTSIVRAPDFDQPGLAWFNVAAPLSLAALRGKLVILDFWTFCCINCMHILPSLRRVEEAFPDEVVVIGVHSPKFAAERETANVAAAIARYGIVHPVIHDPDFRLWREYAVRAWPTLIFVSPDGRVVGQHSGEPDPDRLLEAVGSTLAQWRDEGLMRPGILASTPLIVPSGRLRFPGKIKPAPGTEKRWILADAGHHQIALLDDGGAEIARYGSGEAGLVDGAAGTAQFNGPQGLIADERAIFVADTGNHALRRIDRESGAVTTLAGTGRRGLALGAPAPALATALASPWDLELADGLLYFADAGTHQLGSFDRAAGTVARLAGSGAEALVDGREEEAALAQPSGLALTPDGRNLYIADSETSALRVLRLGGQPRVETLIGTGLFDFGHVNGALGQARLQHPLGIAWWAGRIAVADSYNGAIRSVDPAAGTVSDLDDGLLCTDSVCLPLAEPAGIAADGAHRLLVVDTNNHRVVEYDVAARTSRSWAE
ncbi:MAG TPA: thioredoxin-like domain-containing protein [Stellaceae bacterium]|nr:thioredoxin-like domain-containing protein [Stellaceae bacterium]